MYSTSGDIALHYKNYIQSYIVLTRALSNFFHNRTHKEEGFRSEQAFMQALFVDAECFLPYDKMKEFMRMAKALRDYDIDIPDVLNRREQDLIAAARETIFKKLSDDPELNAIRRQSFLDNLVGIQEKWCRRFAERNMADRRMAKQYRRKLKQGRGGVSQ